MNVKETMIKLNDATPSQWDKVYNTRELNEDEQQKRDFAHFARTMQYGDDPEDIELAKIANSRMGGETMEVNLDDLVDNPSHYSYVPEEYQHHKVMDAVGFNYHFANSMKYLWRAGRKSSQSLSKMDKEIQDVRKAIRYLQMWIELREEEITKGKMTNVK
jgi:hypothetical protein